MMPGLDGFGLLRELRAVPLHGHIPVIMLSARAGEESESEGLEAGADDYLVKPFTARELLARVGAHLSMHRMRRELMHKEQQLRLRAESAESQYRAILESISEGFVFMDRNWRIQYANTVWARFAGMAAGEFLGAELWTAFPGLEDTRFGAAYRESMETGRPLQVEDYFEPLTRWFRVNIYPSADGLSIFAQDVTEQRIQRERLLISEKLAATGRLAATIAHEINNPLEAVLNLVYLARTSRAQAEQIEEFLLTAEKELHRVSHIARHTLGFYRETSLPVQIDLAALLSEVLTTCTKAAFAPRPSKFGRILPPSPASRQCAAKCTRSFPTCSPMPSTLCARAVPSPSRCAAQRKMGVLACPSASRTAGPASPPRIWAAFSSPSSPPSPIPVPDWASGW